MVSHAAANELDALARYLALLGASQTLATHRSIEELFRVLAGELHAVVPFDHLALILHDERADEMRLVILEPELPFPISSQPVAAAGPAAIVWQTQEPSVVRLTTEGLLPPTLEYVRSTGMQVTAFLPLTTAHGRL